MNKLTPCQCCGEKVSEVSKRFEAHVGFVCASCFEFSRYAELRLRRVGIEDLVVNPIRFTPNPEVP